ncbi:MAG: tetratricopeptide repeat protein [Planctomycetes bacterium]|nr:tetratricopeptide repeat protein [Planctomycetota bacterium]
MPTTHYAAPSKAAVYGHTHWGGHYATLSFAFGFGHRARWGCYSFPYHYCATLPSYYDHCWSSYGYYGRHFGLSYYGCFWPRWSFCWSLPLWGSYWQDPYDLYYSPGPSYVVVRESTPSVSVASAGGDEPAESLADVTARHLSLGDFYFEEGRYDEAAESYFRALAYAPDDGSIHFVIADALFAQGDYHFAAHMIQKGLQLDPTLVNATTDKREFYGDPKAFDAQLATLRKYLTEKPYDAAAHAVLGYNLWFSGDRAAARNAFERVREIDPANPIATAFLDDLATVDGRAESADDGVK